MNLKRVLFIFVPICIIVFFGFYYIFFKNGNNKTKEKIVDYIMNNYYVYEADILVTVNSNKNKNEYNMYQIVNHKKGKCIINKPKEIEGLSLETNEGKLVIINKTYNMEKLYEGYNEIINNSLFLSTFLEEIKNNNYEVKETENEYIIMVELLKKQNTYVKYKELYVDKNSKLPAKLIIKNEDQKNYISIIYNNIKIK